MTDGLCENCGDDTEGLVAVHRVYIERAPGEVEATITRVDTAEQWCVPCRTVYPHEPAAD